MYESDLALARCDDQAPDFLNLLFVHPFDEYEMQVEFYIGLKAIDNGVADMPDKIDCIFREYDRVVQDQIEIDSYGL
ncbi:MAG: hypothetical protein ACYCQK_01515 [Acidiferrobacteraceae bacterium]